MLLFGDSLLQPLNLNCCRMPLPPALLARLAKRGIVKPTEQGKKQHVVTDNTLSFRHFSSYIITVFSCVT